MYNCYHEEDEARLLIMLLGALLLRSVMNDVPLGDCIPSEYAVSWEQISITSPPSRGCLLPRLWQPFVIAAFMPFMMASCATFSSCP
jgi:hypothetical protein